MVVACWSVKGGAGTTVTAAALAVTAARRAPAGALLVDLAGDCPAALGFDDRHEYGVRTWLTTEKPSHADALGRLEIGCGERLSVLPMGETRTERLDRIPALLDLLEADGRDVIIDCGTLRHDPTAAQVASLADQSLLVTRCCYLAMRLSKQAGVKPTGVVAVVEPHRALRADDVAEIIGAPLVAELAVDPVLARLVDSGTLVARLGRGIERSLGVVLGR